MKTNTWKNRMEMNETNRNHTTDPDANMESHLANATLRANESSAFDSRVRITFYHTRTRLADIDGLSVKAAIDALVAAGILTDDSAKQVAEVRHCQRKGDPEETRIVIEEIEGDEEKRLF